MQSKKIQIKQRIIFNNLHNLEKIDVFNKIRKTVNHLSAGLGGFLYLTERGRCHEYRNGIIDVAERCRYNEGNELTERAEAGSPAADCHDHNGGRIAEEKEGRMARWLSQRNETRI